LGYSNFKGPTSVFVKVDIILGKKHCLDKDRDLKFEMLGALFSISCDHHH